jgi:hypothetical protein
LQSRYSGRTTRSLPTSWRRAGSGLGTAPRLHRSCRRRARGHWPALHPSEACSASRGGTRRRPPQGWYRAVVAARARDAVARVLRYLLVDALPTSLPILARLGFEHHRYPASTRQPARP